MLWRTPGTDGHRWMGSVYTLWHRCRWTRLVIQRPHLWCILGTEKLRGVLVSEGTGEH